MIHAMELIINHIIFKFQLINITHQRILITQNFNKLFTILLSETQNLYSFACTNIFSRFELTAVLLKNTGRPGY